MGEIFSCGFWGSNIFPTGLVGSEIYFWQVKVGESPIFGNSIWRILASSHYRLRSEKSIFRPESISIPRAGSLDAKKVVLSPIGLNLVSEMSKFRTILRLFSPNLTYMDLALRMSVYAMDQWKRRKKVSLVTRKDVWKFEFEQVTGTKVGILKTFFSVIC
jgi:hypothetical protein